VRVSFQGGYSLPLSIWSYISWWAVEWLREPLPPGLSSMAFSPLRGKEDPICPSHSPFKPSIKLVRNVTHQKIVLEKLIFK